MISFLFQKFGMESQNIDTRSNTLVYEYLRTHKNSNIRKLAEKLKMQVPIQVEGENLSIRPKRSNVNDQENAIEGKEKEQLIAEIAAKDEKIKYLEMLKDESESKLEKMKHEYMVDISSKNDLLERLNKSVAESETKFEKVKQEYEANYNEMLDISRKNQEKANSEIENRIEEIKEEYQAGICSKNCKNQELEMLKTKLKKCEEEKIRNKEKIRTLQDVVTSKEEKIKYLENNLEKTTQIKCPHRRR